MSPRKRSLGPTIQPSPSPSLLQVHNLASVNIQLNLRAFLVSTYKSPSKPNVSQDVRRIYSSLGFDPADQTLCLFMANSAMVKPKQIVGPLQNGGVLSLFLVPKRETCSHFPTRSGGVIQMHVA